VLLVSRVCVRVSVLLVCVCVCVCVSGAFAAPPMSAPVALGGWVGRRTPQ
jgi:hypothetical protein